MATELGQAYVQIIPSAKGISGEIKKTLEPEADTAGKSAGGKIASGIKTAIVAAGIGKILSSAVTEGADLQQSIGGIETLFKDSAGEVRKYADEAFKTVGVSANEYMENVTSFSASLLQSMGGDTEEAAKVAHTAMVDMGDNANKMGTDMRDIQNAYQGFAKQNYTMLDNLKLGYGGTKGEMERLLADAQALTGVEYNIENLDDVFMAVHAIQEELDITGTTALEAEETLTGSLSALKSAFTNTLGAIALGENVTPALTNLSTTVLTFLENLLPMVSNIIMAIPQVLVTILADAGPTFIESGIQAISALLTGLGQALPELIPAAINAILTLVTTLLDNIPLLIESGLNLIIGLAQGLINAIPEIVARIPEIISSILNAIYKAIPLIIEAGIALFLAVVEDMPTIIQGIIDVVPEIISSILNALIDNLPAIIDAGVQLFTALVTNYPKIMKTVLKIIPQIIKSMVETIGKGVSKFASIGSDLIKGMWQGIKDAKDWLLNKISGFVDGIVGGIKDFFGIGSPSKLLRDEVGKWLPEGMAVGITGNIDPITEAMDEVGRLATKPFSFSALNTSGFNLGKQATPEVNVSPVIMLDGKIITKSTSRIQAQNNFGKYRALGVPV